MGLTISEILWNLPGTVREATADFQFDSSYPTGGETLTPAMLGLGRIRSLQVISCPAGYLFSYDRANQKLLAQRVAANGLSVELLDGQNGGSDATYDTVGGEDGDTVVFVGHLTTKASIASLADVTSDFSFTDDNELTDGGPTDYSNDQMLLIYQAATSGALVEVANGTNLSAVTGTLVARGY